MISFGFFSFTVSSGSATYSIGICTLPNNSRDNGAVIQEENKETYVVGQLNQVDLDRGGSFYCHLSDRYLKGIS